jgi:hypothetical protein
VGRSVVPQAQWLPVQARRQLPGSDVGELMGADDHEMDALADGGIIGSRTQQRHRKPSWLSFSVENA